jgi:acyl-CoA thioesterase FadM
MRDGRPVPTNHVPYYLAHEAMSDAWNRAIFTACEGVMAPNELGVVHVSSDFSRELFVGEVSIEVHVEQLGNSSITVKLALAQYDRPAATMTAVLARVDPLRQHSVPLTDAQRSALETLQKT